MDAAAEQHGMGSRVAHAVFHLIGRARLGFRRFRRTRPFWAGFWTMLSGVVVGYVPGTSFKFVFATGNLIWAGVLVGVLIGVLGLFLWIQPMLRYVLGVFIILLSLLSFITSDFGGFFIGMLMGILGGSLAIAWMSNPPPSRRERRRQRRFATEAQGVELMGSAARIPMETPAGPETPVKP